MMIWMTILLLGAASVVQAMASMNLSVSEAAVVQSMAIVLLGVAAVVQAMASMNLVVPEAAAVQSYRVVEMV
jgi:hypothetical protein